LNLIPRKRSIDADDNLGKGMDLALTTLVFLLAGWGLDHWLGTRPLFMATLPLVAFIGKSITLWYAYDARMKVLEAERAEVSRAKVRR
jgi:F0F1-type ATP synthase assembly protein I